MSLVGMPDPRPPRTEVRKPILAAWMPLVAIWMLILVAGERVAAHRGYSPYVVLVLLVILAPFAVFAGLLCAPRR